MEFKFANKKILIAGVAFQMWFGFALLTNVYPSQMPYVPILSNLTPVHATITDYDENLNPIEEYDQFVSHAEFHDINKDLKEYKDLINGKY